MDGRDIGTVVLPDAKIKIYLTASAEARADRRFKELTEKGQVVEYDTILKEIKERDYQDMIDQIRAVYDPMIVAVNLYYMQEMFYH